jgi:hypothetical protein
MTWRFAAAFERSLSAMMHFGAIHCFFTPGRMNPMMNVIDILSTVVRTTVARSEKPMMTVAQIKTVSRHEFRS